MGADEDRIVTAYFLNYIEATRHLWNAHIRQLQGGLLDARAHSTYAAVEVLLFSLLVARPLEIEYDTQLYGRHPPRTVPGVVVRPRRGTEQIGGSDTLSLCSAKAGAYNTESLFRWTTECVLSFMEFYDWDPYTFRDCQYARVLVKHCPPSPEDEGLDALVEVRGIDFVLTDRERVAIAYDPARRVRP